MEMGGINFHLLYSSCKQKCNSKLMNIFGQGKELRSGSKTFMVFGGGVRQCVGAEFARLQISIFIHHLVTTYDFSLAQESEFIRAPLPYFPKGLPIKISQSL